MRETNLRPLAAPEQIEFLGWDAGRGAVARTVTAVLARCVGVSETEAARWTVGEREFWLLQLRRVTLGERIACVLRCPRAECRERMDLDLHITGLLVSRPSPEPSHEVVLDGCHVRFRLPNGEDQEHAAGVVKLSEEEAVRDLLARCVVSVERDGSPLDEVPPAVIPLLSEAMARLDPQAEIVLEPTCPACGVGFRTVFDTASYFFGELAAHARLLADEVHQLATRYKWSEADILGMPQARRRLYLGMADGHRAGRAMS